MVTEGVEIRNAFESMNTPQSALLRRGTACWLAFIPVIYVGGYAIVKGGEDVMVPGELVDSLIVFALLAVLLILYWIKVRYWLKWVGFGLLFISAGLIVKQLFQVFL